MSNALYCNVCGVVRNTGGICPRQHLHPNAIDVAEVEQLRAQLAARDKTLAILNDAVEGYQSCSWHRKRDAQLAACQEKLAAAERERDELAATVRGLRAKADK